MTFRNIKFLVAGCGFFGAVIAERIANILKEHVVVIDKRNHIGGNCYSETDAVTGIEYHKYGTHIFHTSDEKVWNYIRQFTDFNQYRHQVLTTYKNKVYQMPINLRTINAFYGLNLKPNEAKLLLEAEIAKANLSNPINFEERAISLIGRDLYEALIRGYTLKQWQKDPSDLPASIINRLPVRYNYDDRYYYSRWEGIPLNGYTQVFRNMLSNKKIEIRLSTDFFNIRQFLSSDTHIIYSGPIDQYFDYKFGRLEWRTLRFEKEIIDMDDFQGTSVMNYADIEVPFTRIHEPKHLHPERHVSPNKTLIFKEYSEKAVLSNEYYPVNTDKNQQLLQLYKNAAERKKNLIVCGRLGDYAYYDMHQTIRRALDVFENKIMQYG